MPRTISAALQAHLDHAYNRKTLSEWIELAPTGKVIGLTTHSRDLIFDGGTGNGTVRHRAEPGFVRSAFRESMSQKLSTMNIQGYFHTDAVTRADIVAGKYKRAECWFGVVNWNDLSQGVIKMMRGWVGRITVRDYGFDMELRSLLDRFNRQVGETVTPTNVGQFLPGTRAVLNP